MQSVISEASADKTNIWLGMLSLLNDISTFGGYLMHNHPFLRDLLYFWTHRWGIRSKVNVIFRLVFELDKDEVKALKFNHYATTIPSFTLSNPCIKPTVMKTIQCVRNLRTNSKIKNIHVSKEKIRQKSCGQVTTVLDVVS